MRIQDLSIELRKWNEIIEVKAKEYSLDFFPVHFEMVNYREINEIAALGGFPQRYPHWRHGMGFDRISKEYTYGHSKIYEMVINTDPCLAYLLSSNSQVEHKMVMAHVYGHADFFKNNIYFSKTNRKMLDQVANHAVMIRRYQELHGVERVEEFVDAVLSLENLINFQLIGKENSSQNFRVKKNSLEQRSHEMNSLERPERDLLLFLLKNAPLESWEIDILEAIREESYYFAPQRQTKIMNEGWASYWHARILTEKILKDSEVIDYAALHSGTMATPPGGLNPYKLGIELFRDIQKRWDRGQFGKEWDECKDPKKRKTWDKKTNLGMEKIFEVRKLHNDLSFIDAFLTEDFCREQNMFVFSKNQKSGDFQVKSREFAGIKEKLLSQLTNAGLPIIELLEMNYKNRSELFMQHVAEKQGLDKKKAELTLKNVSKLWKRPVHISTLIEGKEEIISSAS